MRRLVDLLCECVINRTFIILSSSTPHTFSAAVRGDMLTHATRPLSSIAIVGGRRIQEGGRNNEEDTRRDISFFPHSTTLFFHSQEPTYNFLSATQHQRQISHHTVQLRLLLHFIEHRGFCIDNQESSPPSPNSKLLPMPMIRSVLTGLLGILQSSILSPLWRPYPL